MSEQERLRSEDLIEIYKARNEWEGNLLVEFFKDNGVEGALQHRPAVPPFDLAEQYSGVDKTFGVFVLEHQAAHARELVKEFLAAPLDQRSLEEEAAHKPPVDKETIAQLRGAVREERRTFRFLGWLAVAFLGATALLWAIWPPWLKSAPPASAVQWFMVVVLAVAAMAVASWASRRP